MNHRYVFHLFGKILIAMTALLALPMIVSLIYKEACYSSFLITMVISLVTGLAVSFVFRTEDKVIFAKEGFLIVALSWIGMSAIGALPFVISGEIPSYVDAFFETVSGFTTTGASILDDVESLSHGLLTLVGAKKQGGPSTDRQSSNILYIFFKKSLVQDYQNQA